MHLMAESKNFLTPPVYVLVDRLRPCQLHVTVGCYLCLPLTCWVDRASALAVCDGWLRVIPLVPASTETLCPESSKVGYPPSVTGCWLGYCLAGFLTWMCRICD